LQAPSACIGALLIRNVCASLPQDQNKSWQSLQLQHYEVTASEKHATGERKKNVKQYKQWVATVMFCGSIGTIVG